MDNDSPSMPEGVDLTLAAIIPVRKRTVTPRGYKKLKANIRELGLIDPLCVCRDGEKYYLLDGYVRYQILLELGVDEAPCLVLERRDFYTPNRQVNNLSRVQEGRMIRKALESVDAETIARHFNIKSIYSMMRPNDKGLHPDVLSAVESGEISRVCARELVFVVPARQVELLEIMRQSGDFSPAFLKTQIIKTPLNQRVKHNSKVKTPWEREHKQKNGLADRLAEANRHFGFFKELFNTYYTDLMRLVIHVRDILEDPELSDWLKKNDPTAYRLFKDTVTECMASVSSRKPKSV